MKKKFTRKVRKNKRSTQRRKNRSYKRMRGGMYDFKTSFFRSKQEIPTNVKEAIALYSVQSPNETVIKSLTTRYSIVINTEDPENELFYTTHEREILEKIKNFTSNTGDETLTLLPITTSTSKPLIDVLKTNGFLPTAEEFTTLFRSFDEEKDKSHKNPFKLNGLALALAIIDIYDDYVRKRPGKTRAPSPPLSPSSPDTTNKPQKYIFVFDPGQATSWEDLKTVIPSNSICHERRRIRMCTSGYWGHHPFGEQPTDRSAATYNKFHIVNGEPLAPEVNHIIHTGDELIRHHLGLFEYDKNIISDNRKRRGEYKFYRIENHTQNIDYTNIRYPTACRNKIFIPVDIKTVYEYGEDGIINWVYISFQHGDVVRGDKVDHYCSAHHTTPSKAVNNEVIVSMENILKLGLNPRVTDIHKIGELQPLIDLMSEIYRGTPPPSLGVTADSHIKTLVMSSPGRWDIFPATRIQQAAFNIVNKYLIERKITSYDMLQIKRFRVSNNMEGPGEITVIIEVKEMNPGGTLKRAICMGETLSQFEVLDTIESASIRKYNKEVNYSQVTSSGPSGL